MKQCKSPRNAHVHSVTTLELILWLAAVIALAASAALVATNSAAVAAASASSSSSLSAFLGLPSLSTLAFLRNTGEMTPISTIGHDSSLKSQRWPVATQLEIISNQHSPASYFHALPKPRSKVAKATSTQDRHGHLSQESLEVAEALP